MDGISNDDAPADPPDKALAELIAESKRLREERLQRESLELVKRIELLAERQRQANADNKYN